MTFFILWSFQFFILFQSPPSSSFSICNFSSTVMGRSDLQRSVSSSTHALVFPFIASFNTVILFISILCLGVSCFFSIYLFSFYHRCVYLSPGSFFVQFMLKRRRLILRCVSFHFTFRSNQNIKNYLENINDKIL
jgi:hypothetical protein